MVARQCVFYDGSRLTWQNREGLLYEEGAFSVLIWMDVEPGFLARGPILRKESLEQWSGCPVGSSRQISASKLDEIVEKVKRYYCGQPLRCL